MSDGNGDPPEGRHDAPRHRHHDRRPGPLVPADHALGHRAERRGDGGLALPDGRDGRASSRVRKPIEVDPELRRPAAGTRPDGASAFARTLVRPGEALVVHISNFRPVKRVADVSHLRPDPAQDPGASPDDRRRPGTLRSPSGWRASADSRTARPSSATSPRSRRSCPSAKLLPAALGRRVVRPRRARGDGVRRAGHRHGAGGLPEVVEDGVDRFPPAGRRRRGHGRRGRCGCSRTPSCGSDSRRRRAAAPSRSSRPTGSSSPLPRALREDALGVKARGGGRAGAGDGVSLEDTRARPRARGPRRGPGERARASSASARRRRTGSRRRGASRRAAPRASRRDARRVRLEGRRSAAAARNRSSLGRRASPPGRRAGRSPRRSRPPA